MLRNYLLIAFRNITKNKVFSLINITGLAIGMAACLLILQYVQFELSYDTYHPNGKDVYRVSLNSFKEGTLETKSAKTYPALGKVMQADFPEVKDFSRVIIMGESIITHEKASVREAKIYVTDTSFVNLFSYPMLQGEAKGALAQPFTVLISKTMAGRIFGKADPMDKTIHLHSNNLKGSAPFIVKGVFNDVPENSHLKPQVLISYPTLHEFIGRKIDDSWQWNNMYTYVQLHPGTNSQALETKLASLGTTYNGKALEETSAAWQFFLQPLHDIHLHSDLQHEPETNGSAVAVYFLLAVAIFILLIALVNFINLSIAQSVRRSKEVGVRKVSGAFRYQLIIQFITEAFLINMFSVILAITIVQLTLPYFGALTGIELSFSLWSDASFVAGIVGLLTVSSLISGAYPAFVLSSFNPIKVFKNTVTSHTGGVFLRKSLVTFQFVMAIVLIAGTLAAYTQLSFMRNQSLGMQIEQTLIVQAPKVKDANGSNWEIFKTELLKQPGIHAVAAADEIPGKEIYWRDNTISLPNQKPSTTFTGGLVDSNFFDLLEVKTVAGRRFNAATDSREKSIILNEAAARVLGFENAGKAVTQTVIIRGKPNEIVGVVEDFHQQSLKNGIEPMIFRYCSDGVGFKYYLVKTNKAINPEFVTTVKTAFDKVFPGNPYDYFFLDDFFNAQYQADQRFSRVFNLFSCLAIFIACLGLFGLTSLGITQRTKEIGVRKVLGASVPHILLLLNKDLFKLLVLANIIAIPLAFAGISQWLSIYAFHTELSPWLLLLPNLIVCSIAFLTVSIQTMKAARENPVKALKNE